MAVSRRLTKFDPQLRRPADSLEDTGPAPTCPLPQPAGWLPIAQMAYLPITRAGNRRCKWRLCVMALETSPAATPVAGRTLTVAATT